MEMFSQAVSWQNFADTISTEAEIREAELLSLKETTEAKILLESWNNRPQTTGPRGGTKSDFTATIAKAARDSDTEVVSINELYLKAKASRKRAQTVRDNSERIAQLISREISRRVGREYTERKQARYLT